MKKCRNWIGVLLALVMTLALLPTLAAAELAEGCKVTFLTAGSAAASIAEGQSAVSAANAFAGYRLLELDTSIKCEKTLDEQHPKHTSTCYNYAYTFHERYRTILLTAAGLEADDDVYTLMDYLLTLNTDRKRQAFAHRVYTAMETAGLAETPDATTGAAPFGSAETTVTHGYWLFVDTTAYTDPNHAKSLYLLDTKGLESITVTPKQTVPTVDKTVSVAGGTYRDGPVSVNIGDSVAFQLLGTLHEYVTSYASYQYVFHDTLSKGLTLQPDSVKVYVRKAGAVDLEVSDNFVVSSQSTSGEFTVACTDLLSMEAEGNEVPIDGDTQIVVQYSAVLNENAVVGGSGNQNSAYLEYSNRYDGTGTGTTPPDTVQVFTFALEVLKVDGADQAPLSGAKFQLYRTAQDGSIQWLKTDENHKVSGWISDTAVDTDKDETTPTTLQSDGDGLFTVTGMEAGTYYLKETEAPKGYNLIKEPILFTVTAQYAEQKLSTLYITVGTAEAKPGVVSTGKVCMRVENKTGKELPSTGGRGTAAFYSLGSLMTVAAGGLLLAARKRTENR